MTITDAINNENTSDNIICPRCSTSLMPHVLFCTNCGQRIYKEKDDQGEIRNERNEEADEQEVADTVRLPTLSQNQLKGLHSNHLFKHRLLPLQIPIRSMIAQDRIALPSGKLTTPSTPIYDCDTKKYGLIPLSQNVEQLTTRVLSVLGIARQQKANRLGSIYGSIRRNDAAIESANSFVGVKESTDEASTTSNTNQTAGKAWGWLPALSLTSAMGLFLQALAATAGRFAEPFADLLYWFGLVVLFLPIAVRILSSQPTRRERIALLVILGSALYLFRFLDYPLSFAYNDEFLHWRGAIDLATYGHLFYANPLLPIGPFYPGMEIVTNALSSLTGLSIFASAMVLLIVVGLVLVLSLYLFFECLSGSARVAGIATLLYMAAPAFLDQTSFAYESLALPLALFVVFVVALRSYTSFDNRVGLTLTIWLGIAAVVMTHHITSYGLLAFLLLWTAVFLLLRKLASSHQGHHLKIVASPGGAAFISLVLTTAWIEITGGRVIGYLYPALESAMQQLIQELLGLAPAHQLFRGASGYVDPLWERMTAIASIALILLGLPIGLFQIWQHHRRNAAILALAGAVLMYPAVQLAHFASIGAVTGRVSAFLFPAIALVLAIGVTRFWLAGTPGWRRFGMVTGAIVIIFIGGCIANASTWYRLPGPYLVAADLRSIDLEGVTAAEWSLSHLGPGHRTVADLTDAFLMGTYGNQWNVMSTYEKREIAPVFTSLNLGNTEKRILQITRTQYLVVDLRISTALPRTRGYFDAGELNAGQYTSPIDPAALTKFAHIQNVSRIFDSGDIVIYDVEGITKESSTTSVPQSLCTPASSTASSPSFPNVAKNYIGTMRDIPTGLTSNMSLTGIQQEQGSICGRFAGTSTNTHSAQIPSNGPFKATITTAGQIEFTLTSGAGKVTFSFDGIILPDGTMTGTYCSPGTNTGKCSDYGLWSVSPAPSG